MYLLCFLIMYIYSVIYNILIENICYLFIYDILIFYFIYIMYTMYDKIKIILALSTSTIICLYTMVNSKHINFKLKYKLYLSLVLSLIPYGCETWTITSVRYNNSKHSKTSPTGNRSG